MSRTRDVAQLPAEQRLLESQVQAINRFPDQNPNPVMRIADDGRLTYANTASEPVRKALGIEVGDVAAALLKELRAVAGADRTKEVVWEHRTFALLPVLVPELGFMNVYGTDITGEKVVERFPNQNPNPVFRVDDDGRLIYANAAGKPLIDAYGLTIGDAWPADIARRLLDAADGKATDIIELVADYRTYALRPVRIPEFGFINVYGTDVTGEKVVAKFPDQNPNPVLRTSLDGVLIYANAASQPIVSSLGLAIGQPLPEPRRSEMLAHAAESNRESIEVKAGERVYALLPVLVNEFDFVNIYGTDVTAAREVERLLLNILPPSIANRLREGEALIADRFDDATLLIADIVGFTALSSVLSADELVTDLDDVFRVCDELVERHGLEKVKTIGDAYMVIGGVPVPSSDHAERMADFALQMTDAVREHMQQRPRKFSFRIGINCGPIVAGVIGSKRTIYDVWGDTVNLASRMEALSEPGRIQVTAKMHDRLKSRYTFEPRGLIDVKGKGPMETYFLVGRT